MIQEKYNVLIIGAGKIGAFFDEPKSTKILTHAHAFSDLDKFNLVGFVNSDLQNGLKAAQIWNTNFFENIESAFQKNKIDIVCVASSTNSHYEILKKLINFPIKLVFAEKPLTSTIEQAEEILDCYEKNKISLLVNYSRRFLPEFEKLREKIKNNFYGNFLWGTGYYGKGVINNGSHIIDLLNLLIDEVKNFNIFSYDFDFTDYDPTVSVNLNFDENKKFFLKHINHNYYTIFELDLFFESGRIKILDSGFKIEEYLCKDSKIFNGYKNLQKIAETDSNLDKAFYFAALNIYEHLTVKNELKCRANHAIYALKTCLNIKNSIN